MSAIKIINVLLNITALNVNSKINLTFNHNFKRLKASPLNANKISSHTICPKNHGTDTFSHMWCPLAWKNYLTWNQFEQRSL